MTPRGVETLPEGYPAWKPGDISPQNIVSTRGDVALQAESSIANYPTSKPDDLSPQNTLLAQGDLSLQEAETSIMEF